jgi:integrase
MQYNNVLALRVSLETGLRIDDVLSLRTENLKGRTIVGIAEKTDKPFKKTLSSDLAKRLRQVSGSIYIFPHRLKKDDHRTRQTVWKDVKKAARLLGIKGNIAPHSARKTYAVELFKDQGITAVQKQLQHDRIGTTMIYAFADLLDQGKKNECSNYDLDLLAEMIADKVTVRLMGQLQNCNKKNSELN